MQLNFLAVITILLTQQLLLVLWLVRATSYAAVTLAHLLLHVLLSGTILPLLALLVHVLLLLSLRLVGTSILNAVTERITDTKVLLDSVDEAGETIIVSVDLHAAADQRVNPIVVPRYVDSADYAKADAVLGLRLTSVHFVVMTRNVQI